MLDYNGEIAHVSRRTNHLMDVEDEYPVVASVSISDYEDTVDTVFTESFCCATAAHADDMGDDCKFFEAISSRAEISKVMGSIASVTTGGDTCELFSDPVVDSIGRLRDTLVELFDDATIAKIATVQASKNQGVSKEILSKIWMVSDELAKGAIDHNTQFLCKHHADNSLSCHFTTNDRMLRYKRLKSLFFTDTLVSLSTKSTSSGNSYAQVFVSDKGYIAVYATVNSRLWKKGKK